MAALEASNAIGVKYHRFPDRTPLTITIKERPPHRLNTIAVVNEDIQEDIHITENDANINPSPITVQDDDVFAEYISPQKLRDLSGFDSLDKVRYLEMKVNTEETSLGNFGNYLPNLEQLKLSNSIISSVRDLGSSLNRLHVLWLARCGLCDLEGLSSLSHLHELYLAYNEICDINPCSMLSKLKVLDLEGNNIEDISQVEYLSLCPALTHLTLESNPVCIAPCPLETDPEYNYRRAVSSLLPNLKQLDDEPLASPCSGKKGGQWALPFAEDWKLISELLTEGALEDVEDAQTEEHSVSGERVFTPIRPVSALKPGTATGIRPGSHAVQRPLTAIGEGRPSSHTSQSSCEDLSVNETSVLTLGGVVCGNLSRALRQRKVSALNSSTSTGQFAQLKFKAEHTHESGDDVHKADKLFSELHIWKEEHQRKLQELEKNRDPSQILTIHHDDAESASDEDVISDSDKSDGAMFDYSKMGARPKVYPTNRKIPNRSKGENIASGDASDEQYHRSSQEHRPISGPVTVGPRGKFKLHPVVDKSKARLADSSPVLALADPPTRVTDDMARTLTAKAALTPVKPTMRRSGQLPAFPVLPSKFAK